MVVMQADCSNEYLKSLGVETLEEEMPVLRIQPFKLTGTTTLDWRQKSLVRLIE